MNATTKARATTKIKMISGIGLSVSAANGAKMVAILAKKLQIPIAVDLFKKGKIESSTKEAM